jgi:hypothetical protein
MNIDYLTDDERKTQLDAVLLSHNLTVTDAQLLTITNSMELSTTREATR